VFDAANAFVTSANLTKTALTRNHEFGVKTENAELVASASKYFEGLWGQAGNCLTQERIAEWHREIRAASSCNNGAKGPALSDHGTDCGINPVSDSGSLPSPYEAAPQFFVKFFGESDDRAGGDMMVMDEIRLSGCHWACTYPKGKRPRGVQDGAVMFIARLVADGDIRIFGRAIGRAYKDGADDASPADIDRRIFKADWPHYIRVHEAEFVKGRLQDGVSLAELMKKFGASSFASSAAQIHLALPQPELQA